MDFLARSWLVMFSFIGGDVVDTEMWKRPECACAQTLLGILITMLWSWGATELLELSSPLFQGGPLITLQFQR